MSTKTPVKTNGKSGGLIPGVLALFLVFGCFWCGATFIFRAAGALRANIDSNYARMQADAPEIVSFLHDSKNFNELSNGNTYIQYTDVDAALKDSRFSDVRSKLQKVQLWFYSICLEPDKDSICVISEISLQRFAIQTGVKWPPQPTSSAGQ